MDTIPYLHLDRIITDHHLMKILPPEVAYRYHALPVATDGNRITVAMASPEDNTASDAVISAIDAPICFVQADPQEIDQRLDKIWSQNSTPNLRFLYWHSPFEEDETQKHFAQLLTGLFDVDIIQVDIPLLGVKSFLELSRVIEQIRPDLFIFPTYHPLWLKQFLSEPTSQFFINQLAASIFIPRNLRWPLKKILLALPDSNTKDESAIRWTVQVSCSNHSAVTILPLLPPVPGLYGSLIQHNLNTILTAKDSLGQKMRSIAEKLSEVEIQGTYKLRGGEPQAQLRDELETSDPDLVIIASAPPRSLRGWRIRELTKFLLRWDNRPLLIAKSIRMDKK